MSTNALAIREAIFLRLQTLPGYAKYRRILTPQLQPDDLPCISASIISEDMIPDGDGNAGEPSFVSTCVIGISVTRGFDDPVVLDGKVDEDIISIEQKLLTDPTFVCCGANSLFESVEHVTRRRKYPFQGETYFLELQLEMTFISRADFPPLVESPFAIATITSRPSDDLGPRFGEGFTDDFDKSESSADPVTTIVHVETE